MSRKTMTLTIINEGNSRNVYKEIIDRSENSSVIKTSSFADGKAVEKVNNDSFKNTLGNRLAVNEAQGKTTPDPLDVSPTVPGSANNVSPSLLTGGEKSANQDSTALNNLLGLNSTAAAKAADIVKDSAKESPITVPAELEPIFKKATETYGVDEGFLIAMAKQESNFQADATSSSGAMGILQLMPETAEYLGVKNAYNPEENIMGAAKLLSGHLKKYNGDYILALAAYGAGGGAVKKYGNSIPPFLEIQNHIPRVLHNYSRGYTTSDGSKTVMPEAEKLADLVIKYKNTKGSAFDRGVAVSDRQKDDLAKLLVTATSKFL